MSGQCFEHLEEAHNAKQSFIFHILISKYIRAAKIQSGVCQQCWCKSLASHINMLFHVKLKPPF